MPSVRMHVRGKERLFAKLRAMDDAIESEVADAALKGAEEIADMAQRLAPRNPATASEYWRSINARPVLHISGADNALGQGARLQARPGEAKRDVMSRGVAAAGVFASWRWRFVEFGTRNNPAYPHLIPSYRALRRRINSRMARAINKAMKRIAARGGSFEGLS